MKLKSVFFAVLSATLILLSLPNASVMADQTQAGVAANPAPSTTTSKAKDSTAVVNINTADAPTLETLKDIGPKRSAAIIAYRQQNGPFKSVQDLTKVKGVPQTVIADNPNRLIAP